jgi:acrylyl-CoA reductase (NADPH)
MGAPWLAAYDAPVRAFVIDSTSGALRLAVEEVDPSPVEPDDGLVDVEWSSVNFKDAMAAEEPSRVRRRARLIGGIDAAGTLAADLGALPAGTVVAVHGGDVGVARDGGFAERLYAPARLVSPLPEGLSARQAAIVGTAGLTAAVSLLELEARGLGAGGRVLVTGATGGVGSSAVAFAATRGYEVVAATGSPQSAEWLRELGAHEIVGRDAVADRPERVLGSELWDGAIDCVGGETLAQVLRSLRYGATVAASGLVGGPDVATTVYPFITRAVALVGVDTVALGGAARAQAWHLVAEVARAFDLESLCERVADLDDLAGALEEVRAGATRGRILVRTTP